MRRKRFLGFLPAFCLLALPLFGLSELKLGNSTGEYSDQVAVELTLTTDDQVQGLVAVFEWDTSGGVTGVDLVPVSPLLDSSVEEGADTVVTRVEDGYMVLGVVMDSNPNDNGTLPEVIGPGTDIPIATATLTGAGDPGGGSAVVTDLVFVDDAYASTEGGPVLDNIVVVGGLSQGDGEGLTLVNGQISSTAAPDKLAVESTTAEATGPAEVNILMDVVTGPVEGFVVSICTVGTIVLPADAADMLGADAAQADFVAVEQNASGVAVGVVIDLIDPMELPPNIETGPDKEVLTLTFAAPSMAQGDPDIVVDIALCDGQIGDPLKENLIVVGGMSIAAADGLALEGGTLTWTAPTGPIPTRETNCDDGIDDDQDGLIDMDDPDCQRFDFESGVVAVGPDGQRYVEDVCAEGPVGGVASTMLHINSPDVNADGVPDAVQGFSLGFAYNCDEVAAVEGLDVTGTILEAVGAEYVGMHADNAADDGDGCSLVIGVLLDAVPPFGGQVIPGLPSPQALGRLSFQLLDTVECGAQIVVSAQDGVNGRGEVPVRNLVSIANYAVCATVRDICLTSTAEERFYRGDCNFDWENCTGEPVNIADAAAVVSFLFQESIFKFDPPCLDACDAQDDGRVDLADAISILMYLFQPGAPFPPAPGPGLDGGPPGVDPTEDPLDCAGGSDCNLR